MASGMAFIIFLLTVLSALGSSPTPSMYEVYRFPNGTWVENIAVRPNGNLLVTLVNTPELWEITPSTHLGHSTAQLLCHFDRADSVNGITELSPDIYAVVASNSVWKVDLSVCQNVSKPIQIATLPAGTLNGMATLDEERRSVAISDSQLGLVWRLDTHTGNYTVIHQDETMAPTDELGLMLGINGLRITNGYLYYNNSPRRIFCRVHVDRHTGGALGPYETIAHNVLADDFAVNSNGVAYLAGLTDNVVTKVFPNGSHKVIAGSLDSKDLMTATSAAFGKLPNGRDILYVTTGGESEHPVNNTYTRGGKIMALAGDL
jgi:sugar lactone lactonase YvrE